jgi:DNA-binding NarL/FixJ family response regulator
VRVVVGEDSLLVREGIVRVLGQAGFEVVAQAGDAAELMRKVSAHRPDVAVVDIRMLPSETDDGLRAAIEIRRRQPETGVVVLSQYLEEGYALDLVGDRPEGTGYLLKDRVGMSSGLPTPSVASARAARHSTRRSSPRCWVAVAATIRSPGSPSESATCSR